MELYFTRHGKTLWNQEQRFQGMSGDSPLLPESYKQIAELSQKLETVPFKRIYSSPSLRAKTTAETIAKELLQPVTVITRPELMEMNLGALEGQLIAEMQQKYPQELFAMRHNPALYDPTAFHGETFTQMINRVTSCVEEIVAQEEGPLLFVGHGASLTAAIQSMIGKPLAEVRAMGGLSNNSLTVLEAAGKQTPYQLKKWNETDFLTNSENLICIP